MLNRLQNIRRLLISPSPGNIRIANAELQALALPFKELAKLLSTPQESAPVALSSLAGMRLELSAIAALSLKASDYFNRLGQLRASNFGAYGRTGAWRSLDTASRVIVQL
jgi:hypothetical protein